VSEAVTDEIWYRVYEQRYAPPLDEFANPTREGAYADFFARKDRHARILEAQLDQIHEALHIARRQFNANGA
jgi:hypothetical protein